MDPLESLKPSKDSTLAMIEAAQNKNWQVSSIPLQGLFYDNKRVICHSQILKVNLQQNHWFQTEAIETHDLASFDVVMMRKDPPFNMAYIYATYLLELAEEQGVKVFNKPRSIRDANEKLFTLQFSQCTPPVMVSANSSDLKQFHETYKDVIFKPLDGMGGASIFRLKADDPNVSVTIETLTEMGNTPIMAQKFITQISQGDKRILMINGHAVSHSLARIPAKGETRGNLAAGGSGKVQPLSDRDRWIAEQVGPTLKKMGLVFVGLDVIGDYLTEINVTSPTCIQEISKATQIPIAQQLMEEIANLCG